MGTYLNPGNAGFEAIRNSLYVDKSGLISFVNSTIGTVNKLTCASRPRRFGKSFAAKMLCAYYDISCDSEKLFLDLKIAIFLFQCFGLNLSASDYSWLTVPRLAQRKLNFKL